MLEIESNKNAIKRLNSLFKKNMRKNASDRILCYTGYRGGRVLKNLDWLDKEKIWLIFDHADGNRFWNAFGTSKPIHNGTVPITVEINFPYSGIKRGIGGVFLTDNHNGVYLAHRGKIGGGKLGIGKKLFFENTSADEFQIVKDGNKESKVFIIGDISSINFPSQVASFIRKVEDIKKEASKIRHARKGDQSYNPEFFGEKTYDIRKTIKSNCDHGRIVDSLKRIIKDEYKYDGINDGKRDLYIDDNDHHLSILFEVKTVLVFYNLYTAIGQLNYHKVSMRENTKKVIVLPKFSDKKVKKALITLNIIIVQYVLNREKVIFSGLDKVFS